MIVNNSKYFNSETISWCALHFNFLNRLQNILLLNIIFKTDHICIGWISTLATTKNVLESDKKKNRHLMKH